MKTKPWLPRPNRRLTREERDERAQWNDIQDLLERDGAFRDAVRSVLDVRPPWTPFQDVTGRLSSPLARQLNITDPEILRKTQEITGTGNRGTRTFENSRYFVHVTPSREGWTLSIRSQQNDAVHDWRDFQRIKNELVGPQFEAVELYPRESRLVDTSNQYFLHVLPPGMEVPCGFRERMVFKPRPNDSSGSNQRPWEPGQEPADAQDVDSDRLMKLVYQAAQEAVAREKDGHGEGREAQGEENAECAGDRGDVVGRPPDDEQGRRLHRHVAERRVVEQSGVEPSELGQGGQGGGPDRQDHAQAAGAGQEDHREVRGPAADQGRQEEAGAATG